MVTITIKTDNAAFHDENGEPSKYFQQLEVVKILGDLIKRIHGEMECGGFLDEKHLMDTNGNCVGMYEATIEED